MDAIMIATLVTAIVGAGFGVASTREPVVATARKPVLAKPVLARR